LVSPKGFAKAALERGLDRECRADMAQIGSLVGFAGSALLLLP
jgi:hypothetical protein